MSENLMRHLTEEYTEYLRDESRTIGTAESISFPKNADEIAEILKCCNEKGIRVTLQGGRTGLAAAAVPMGGHIMNLSRMKGILSMRGNTQEGYYLWVEPGVVLLELKKAITSKKFDTTSWDCVSQEVYRDFLHNGNYFFSPDPTETSATIGGMVACNASGAKSYLYGATRKHITGLTVVLTDGDSLTLKRGENFAKGRELNLLTQNGKELTIQLPSYQMPSTKNASGYFVEDNMDAIDLFIGSDGTLGVITAIEIALLPLPKLTWGATCFFDTETTAIACISKIREEISGVAAMEYFDGDALGILRSQKNNNPAFAKLPLIPQNVDAAVYFELHGDEEAEMTQRLCSLGESLTVCGGDPSLSWVARNGSDLDRLMFFRHAVPESVNMLIDKRRMEFPTITKLGTDMAVENKDLAEVVAMYRQGLAEKGLQSAVWGHIGDNHLHVNILPRNPEDYKMGKELYVQWAKRVTALGGAVSAEHGVGKLKANMLTVMYGEENINAMRKLKYLFDPKGILGVGNMMEVK